MRLNNQQIKRLYDILDFDRYEEIIEAKYESGRFFITLIDNNDDPIIPWEYRPGEIDEYRTRYVIDGYYDDRLKDDN